MYIINLHMGDSSNDGHEKSAIVTIRSNITKTNVEAAYAAGVKKTNVDWSNVVAVEYKDNIVPKNVIKKLAKHGFFADDELDHDDEGYVAWIDTYANIWLFIAKLGNPNFKYEIVDDEDCRIDIGGYGLF